MCLAETFPSPSSGPVPTLGICRRHAPKTFVAALRHIMYYRFYPFEDELIHALIKHDYVEDILESHIDTGIQPIRNRYRAGTEPVQN